MTRHHRRCKHTTAHRYGVTLRYLMYRQAMPWWVCSAWYPPPSGETGMFGACWGAAQRTVRVPDWISGQPARGQFCGRGGGEVGRWVPAPALTRPFSRRLSLGSPDGALRGTSAPGSWSVPWRTPSPSTPPKRPAAPGPLRTDWPPPTLRTPPQPKGEPWRSKGRREVEVCPRCEVCPRRNADAAVFVCLAAKPFAECALFQMCFLGGKTEQKRQKSTPFGWPNVSNM